MNIVAFIPARSGSKSIKDKNIKLLGGKPLLVWTIEKAFKAGIGRVVVNTDSEEYGRIAEVAGAEIMIRPKHLAKDTTSMFELLKNEIPYINPVPDLVLLLQPTFFPRKSVYIKTAISYLTENIDKYDSLVSVEQIPEKYHPAVAIIGTSNGKAMVMGKFVNLKDKIKSWFTGVKHTKPSLTGVPISQRMTRRQDHPEAWIPTGEIYAFKTENLKKGSFYGERVMLLETNKGGININDPEDWELAEKLCEQKSLQK